MNIKRPLLAASFAFAVSHCMAQAAPPENLLTSAGGSSSTVSASLSWTIGEPIIETGSSTISFLTQGFQQPSQIIVTSVNNPDDNGSVSAYPNPTVNSVFITTSNDQPVKVDVVSMDGKKLLSASFTGNESKQVDVSNYAFGIYLFKVYTTDGKLLKTLKIEKVK